jgi:hypothetical protein
MERYSQHRLFVMSTWLLMLARFAFVFLGGLLVVLLGFFWPAGYVWPPKWWVTGFLSVFGMFLVVGWTGVLGDLASPRSCDDPLGVGSACHRAFLEGGDSSGRSDSPLGTEQVGT